MAQKQEKIITYTDKTSYDRKNTVLRLMLNFHDAPPDSKLAGMFGGLMAYISSLPHFGDVVLSWQLAISSIYSLTMTGMGVFAGLLIKDAYKAYKPTVLKFVKTKYLIIKNRKNGKSNEKNKAA